MAFMALFENATRNLDGVVARALEQELGRPVRLRELDVLRPGRLHVAGLEVAAGPSFADGLLLSVPEMTARYRLVDMMLGRVDPLGSISRVDLSRPYILITRDKDSRINLQDFFPKEPKAPAPSPFRGVVRIRNGTVRFVDDATRDLPEPQANILRGVDATLDAAAPPLMFINVAAEGDRLRIGRVTGRGSIQPDTGGMNLRIRTETGSAPYWLRYFAQTSDVALASGAGVAEIFVERQRQRDPVDTTIVIRAWNVSGRSRHIGAPFHDGAGAATIRLGDPQEISLDARVTSAGIPVRVTGSVFTGNSARLALRGRATNVTLSGLRRLFPAAPETPWATLRSPATVEADIYGATDDPIVAADVQVPNVILYNRPVREVRARLRYEGGRVYIPRLTARADGGGPVTAAGTVNTRTGALRIEGSLPGLDARALGIARIPISGTISARLVVTGTTTHPRARVAVLIRHGSIRGAPFDRLTARVTVSESTVFVEDAVVAVAGGTMTTRGLVGLNGALAFQVNASGVRLGPLLSAADVPDATGTAYFRGRVDGTVQAPRVAGLATLYDATFRGQRLDFASGRLAANLKGVHLDDVTMARYPTQARVSGDARFLPGGGAALDLLARLDAGRLGPLLQDAGLDPMADANIVTEAPIRIGGTLAAPDIRGRLVLTDMLVEGFRIRRAEAGFRLRDSRLSLSNIQAESARGGDEPTRLTMPSLLIGDHEIVGREPFTVTRLQLRHFRGLGYPFVNLDGSIAATGTIGGTRESPEITARVRSEALTVNAQAFTDIRFEVGYAGGKVSINNLGMKRNGSELLTVSKADWNPATRTARASVTTRRFPLQMVVDMLQQSDWYYSAGGLAGRRAVESLERLHISLNDATLTLGNAVLDDRAEGTLELTVELPTNASPRLSLAGAAELEGVSVQDQRLDSVTVAGRLNDLREDRGRLLASFDVPDGQFAAISGGMQATGGLRGAVGADIEADLDVFNVPVSLARLFLDSRPERRAAFDASSLEGVLTLSATVTGRWNRPTIIASVSGQKLRAPGSAADLTLSSQAIRVENTPSGTFIRTDEIRLLAKDHALRMSGSVPFDWGTKTIPRDEPISLTAHVDEQGLDIIGLLLGGAGGPIETATGSVVADLSLDGTLNQRKITGYIQVNDGNVKMRALNSTFRNIQVDLRLDTARDALVVHQLSLDSSDGGSIRLLEDSIVGLPSLRNPTGGFRPDLRVAVNGFRVKEKPNGFGYGEHVEGTLSTPPDAPLRITSANGDAHLNGLLTLSDVSVTPPNSIPAAKESRGTPSFNPAFDLSLVVGKNVWVRSSLFRVHLNDRGGVENRSVRVTGNLAQPKVVGRLTSHEGTIVYPTARFRLTDATVQMRYPPVEGIGNLTLAEEGFQQPGYTVDAEAQARLIATVSGRSQPVTVFLHLEGPRLAANQNEDSAFGTLSPYRITLRSSPSLPERQLVALITREEALQRLAEGGNPQAILEQETMNILQASVLPEALSGFESRLGEVFGLEALTLDYTMANSTLSITATKRLTDRLSLTYSRPITESGTENAYTLSLDYQINPRLRLTLEQKRDPFITGLYGATPAATQPVVTDTSLLVGGSFPF